MIRDLGLLIRKIDWLFEKSGDVIFFIICNLLVNSLAGRGILEEALEDLRICSFCDSLAFRVVAKLATAIPSGESLSHLAWLVEVVRVATKVFFWLVIFSRFLAIVESTLRLSVLEGVPAALSISVSAEIFLKRVIAKVSASTSSA